MSMCNRMAYHNMMRNTVTARSVEHGFRPV